MALSGSAKELKPLIDEIRKNGFKVAPSGKHRKVVDVEGKIMGARNKVVTDENGPIIISSTPGDFRARDMHVKRLLKRKVILRDPWAVDKGEGKEGRKAGFSEEDRQRGRERVAEEARRRHERTMQVRARIEPIIAKLGGWDKRGMVSEIGRVALHFTTKQHKPGWKTEAGAMQGANSLKKGNTLSDAAVDAWNLLCDELEKAWRKGPGTSPNDEALRERYFELVRESKGIAPEPEEPKKDLSKTTPVIRSQIKDTKPDEPSEPRRSGHMREGILGEKMPTLALKAVFLMSMGREGQAMPDVLEVGEDILRLELASMTDA